MNKLNVYRVDTPLMYLFTFPIGIGPYSFFNYFAGKERWEKWSKHCGKHEPCENIYTQFKVNPFRLKKVPTLPSERRPGPFEDMGMRRGILALTGEMNKIGKELYYCFDSISQFKSWFHDPEELKFLADNCFVLSHYIVRTSSVINGNKQSLFLREGFLYLKTRYNLQTMEPLLPINIPKPNPKPMAA